MRPRLPSPPAIALVALTLCAWCVALTGSFQFDDLPNIVLDPATSDATALRQRLANGFRPLLRLSYVADHALWGFVPAGFLATNLLLHAGTVLAVWALARRRLDGAAAAFAAAAVFALQPAHAAVLASASGRSTGLSTLLLVLALLAHERAFAGAAVRGRRWVGASLLLFALAVAAKEVALVFPALLLLWELTRERQPDLATAARRIGPAAVAAAVLAVLSFAFSSRLREIVGYSLALGTPLEALVTHAAALPFSLALWGQPWALSIEHAPLPAQAALPGAVVLVAIVVLALACRRRAPLATLALLWPLVMLLPTHSLLARLDPVVEKALYPAWIGPSLGIGALVGVDLARLQAQRALARMASVMALALLGSACAWRAARWADPPALWREATVRAPLSARAWHNRAQAEFGAGRIDEASASIGRAMALDPASPRTHDTARAISMLLPPAPADPPKEPAP